MAKKDTGK